MSCKSESSDIIENGNEEEPVPSILKDRTYKKVREDISLTGKEKALSKSQIEFSFSVIEEFEKDGDNKRDNFIISPFSVHQCLSMLANGLSEEAGKDILKILLPESTKIEDLNSYSNHITTALFDIDNLSDMVVSNSIWTSKGYSVSDVFFKTIKESYKGACNSADLFSDEGKNKVNRLVNRQTYGLIPDFFDAPPCVSALLVNALYFRAPWYTNQFELAKGNFRNIKGESIPAEFVTYTDYFNIYKDDLVQVLSVEYGNGAFRLNIVQPVNYDTELGLSSNKWKEITSALKRQYVNFFIPRFNVEYKGNIMDVLSKLGLSDVFKGKNLSKISSDIEDLKLFQHSAVLKVDEKGSEGAAASAAGWISGEGFPTPELFKADRPFMFILDEVSTGTILFMGRINTL